jgi:hypothetical protein
MRIKHDNFRSPGENVRAGVLKIVAEGYREAMTFSWKSLIKLF